MGNYGILPCFFVFNDSEENFSFLLSLYVLEGKCTSTPNMNICMKELGNVSYVLQFI